ncbi:MAG: 4Fe-4S binding protein [bacterium]
MNTEEKEPLFNAKALGPYSVFVFNAGSCGGCELEILSLFTHSNQSDGLRCEFVSQPESANLILLFGSLNRESGRILKEFLPRFGTAVRRLAVGACAISGGVYQYNSGMHDSSMHNPCTHIFPAYDPFGQSLIQEYAPDLYVAGCPPGPEDIWQGIQYLVSGAKPEESIARVEFRPELCLGCGLCQKICPGKAIRLIGPEEENSGSGKGKNKGVEMPAGSDASAASEAPVASEAPAGLSHGPSCLMEFNQGACLFCSLCEQLCPTGCIRLPGIRSPLVQSQRDEFMVRGSLPLIRCLGCRKWMVAMPEAFVRQLYGSLPDHISQSDRAAWTEMCPTCRRFAFARHLKISAETMHYLHSVRDGQVRQVKKGGV